MIRRRYLRRQLVTIVLLTLTAIAMWATQTSQPVPAPLSTELERAYFGDVDARTALERLEVKGRAAKTGYTRKQFGDGWGKLNGCSVREVILARDLVNEKLMDGCRVASGILHDPYTGGVIQFQRGPESSKAVQIDHVVALSDAWQKGAQLLSEQERVRLANDPLNLLASEGQANQNKGDADAATWLPPHKPFRCQYVARQVAVKKKYRLWVTDAEKRAMNQVLQGCGH